MTPSLLRLASARTGALATLVAVGGCAGEPAAPELAEEAGPAGVILGTVHAPGVTTFTGLTARVLWDGQEATSSVNADGSFAVPLLDAVEGFGELRVETPEESGLRPAWVLLTPGDLDGQGTLVLMPSRWTLEAGDYAGTEVAIAPELATDTRVMPAYWGSFFPFRQDGFLQTILDPGQWTGAFSSWPSDALPIPLALDRGGSNTPFAAADSVALWRHVDALESALGRDVFRPAAVGELRILGGVRRADGAVLVQLDSTLSTRGVGDVNAEGGRAWTLTADATTWSDGGVRRVGFVSEDITGARVVFHDAAVLADGGLVIHELMHTLGPGHGCSWPSVQTYCESLRRDVPTAEDVAYLEVLEATRRLENELGTRWGVLAAVLGARAVTLGQDPLPTPSLVYGPSSSGGSGGGTGGGNQEP